MFILVVGYVIYGVIEELFRMRKRIAITQRLKTRRQRKQERKLAVINGSRASEGK
jgi:hypothetical protein